MRMASNDLTRLLKNFSALALTPADLVRPDPYTPPHHRRFLRRSTRVNKSNGVKNTPYGSWPDSDIFGTDMFGSAIGTLNDGHEISDGWFAGIKRAYDPHNTLVDEGIDTNHNVYGYVDAGYNFQVRIR